jgi:hypothetical protein
MEFSPKTPRCKIIGELQLSRLLSMEEHDFFEAIIGTRRIKHNTDYLWYYYNGKFGNPFAKNQDDIYGVEGTFFCKPEEEDDDRYKTHVIDYNIPPGIPSWSTSYFVEKEKAIQNGSVPSLQCHWTIQNNRLLWNTNPYFYEPVAWLRWLITNLFEPRYIFLNGSFEMYTSGVKPTNNIYTIIDNKIRMEEILVDY